MDFVIANQEKVNAMIKTTLKIDGMMCGMCESHMNDLIRKNFQVKKGNILCERRRNSDYQ